MRHEKLVRDVFEITNYLFMGWRRMLACILAFLVIVFLPGDVGNVSSRGTFPRRERLLVGSGMLADGYLLSVFARQELSAGPMFALASDRSASNGLVTVFEPKLPVKSGTDKERAKESWPGRPQGCAGA